MGGYLILGLGLECGVVVLSLGSRTPQNPLLVLNTLSKYPCGNLESSTCVTLNGSGIQLVVGPQPLWLRNHNSGPAHRIMYGPFNPNIPIRSATIGKSRVAIDPIAMYTSWRSNSDIASVTSIGYPRMSASGESSTTMHRILHASGSHPIPTPYDPKFHRAVRRRFRVSAISPAFNAFGFQLSRVVLEIRFLRGFGTRHLLLAILATSCCLCKTPAFGFEDQPSAGQDQISRALNCGNRCSESEFRNPSHFGVRSVHSCASSPLEACQEPLIVRAPLAPTITPRPL
ncbi:calmodulin-binding transcription activator (camta), plant [Dorcoceras hygrometricum]|uniref:Calmodulin-binding transcription activator (Camta), plant n=1 Tax=Dorcoceras hygrometricum TaxID=472368 RepID=A0A2Z7C297_9LAMI|nr:calmodulin-binding transcription activator (camta), plant [Dorcoceras hygrometricum]